LDPNGIEYTVVAVPFMVQEPAAVPVVASVFVAAAAGSRLVYTTDVSAVKLCVGITTVPVEGTVMVDVYVTVDVDAAGYEHCVAVQVVVTAAEPSLVATEYPVANWKPVVVVSSIQEKSPLRITELVVAMVIPLARPVSVIVTAIVSVVPEDSNK
jgi:hypothetical protein